MMGLSGKTGRKTASEKKIIDAKRILDTKVQLELLKEKYAVLLDAQRRELKKTDLTPREKELAQAKVHSAICAYTICDQAYRDLNEVTSELAFNSTLKTLNRSLKTVNKYARKGRSIFTIASINRQTKKLKDYEDGAAPKEVFTDETLGTVDEWLGSKWESAADKYLKTGDLKTCLKETRILLETEPLAFQDEKLFDTDDTSINQDPDDSMLNDLLNSDIFGKG